MSTGEKSIKNVLSCTAVGEQITFPLAVVKGDYPGPTLGIAAGIHGGEYCGIEAAISLYSVLEPSRIKGEIRIVPVSNLPGFMARQMFVVPQDGRKLSQSFPGSSSGSYSEKLAKLIYREIVEPSDVVIEFRGGELVEAMAQYVSIQEKDDEKYNAMAREMADVFGSKNVILRKPREGSASESVYTAATFSGKVGILAEAGGQGARSEDDVNFLVSGVMNIAAHLKMVDRQLPPTDEHLYLDSFIDVTSPAEGVFDPKVIVNEEVKKGSLIGVVRDFGGETIEEIHSPEDGVVLGIVTAAGVSKGVTVIGLGRKSPNFNNR